MVPPPPQLSGPISGAGKGKMENLKALIAKEEEQLRSIRRDEASIQKLISYHKQLVSEANE